MNIEDLTLKQIRELQNIIGGKTDSQANHPYKVGQSYLIRTVTMIQVGRLEAVYEQELVLSSASWVADTGRFHNALKTGKLAEVEPFPDVAIIGRGSIVDAAEWSFVLPRGQI